jgi:hypothetical protein
MRKRGPSNPWFYIRAYDSEPMRTQQSKHDEVGLRDAKPTEGCCQMHPTSSFIPCLQHGIKSCMQYSITYCGVNGLPKLQSAQRDMTVAVRPGGLSSRERPGGSRWFEMWTRYTVIAWYGAYTVRAQSDSDDIVRPSLHELSLSLMRLTWACNCTRIIRMHCRSKVEGCDDCARLSLAGTLDN